MSFQIKEKNIPLTKENVIVSFDEQAITSNEYYDNLKNSSGINLLLEMIDKMLLEEKYSLNEESINNVKDKMNDTIQFYINYYDTTEKEFLVTSGFKNKEDFLEFLILEEMRTSYEKDYLKEKITNNEINNYYLNKMNNDFEIMYIKGKDNVLTEILVKLNNSLTIEELTKEYKNKITYQNLGYISFDNEEINSDIYNDALNLNENTYTTSLRSINDEYYIIFKGNVKEKDKVENLKERIRSKMALEKINNDTDGLLLKEALINLRKQANITFYDTYLENLYQTYIKEN